jgi:ABC-2 type transport system permease protein
MTAATAHVPTRRPVRRRMGPWRLEWLRMSRSPRGLALIGVYVFFGLVGPLVARYLSQLVRYASTSGLTIVAPEPRPADGIVNYVHQGSQTGMIVLIVIAAGVLSFGARRGLAVFYRTRASGPFALLWPRFVAVTALAVTAYLLGTAAAWFETAVVLGPLPAGRVLLGVALEAVFLAFAAAVVAAASTVGRSTLSTAGISFAVLLVALPVAGIVRGVGTWLPTRLLTAPAALVTDAGVGDVWKPVAVSLVATAGLLLLATGRARRREL